MLQTMSVSHLLSGKKDLPGFSLVPWSDRTVDICKKISTLGMGELESKNSVNVAAKCRSPNNQIGSVVMLWKSAKSAERC